MVLGYAFALSTALALGKNIVNEKSNKREFKKDINYLKKVKNREKDRLSNYLGFQGIAINDSDLDDALANDYNDSYQEIYSKYKKRRSNNLDDFFSLNLNNIFNAFKDKF